VVTFDADLTWAVIVSRLRVRPADGAVVRQTRSTPVWGQFLAPALALACGFLGPGLVGRAVISGCAIPIVRRAFRSLRRRELTIDVLDTIAVALLLGTGDLIAAGVTVSLVETGERIRHRAHGRARNVMRAWMGADSRGARLQQNASEPLVPIASVRVGDRIVVYAGENVPVDGLVVSGSGSLDTRSWTGESLPQHRGLGNPVLAGTSLADGRIVVEVTATGDETRAGRLTVALEETLAANTQVSDLAHRVADRFVAPVLMASGLVFAGTRDLTRAISILIFDYGTGVRIAIPTTILTTMIAGARQGVIFKSGRAVEELARVDTVVFDKTGTLTSGVLRLRVRAAPHVGEREVLRLVAAAEGHLPHPIARAIRRSARAHGLDLPEPASVRYTAGDGVQALVEGRQVMAGDRRLLESAGIEVPFARHADPLSVLVALDGRYAASIRLKDDVREDARRVVVALRRSGVRTVWLASGDHNATVRGVSRYLNLDGYSARLMPEDKAELVRRLRRDGRTVGVVGDGINDAPAMAEANVSIAVPRGADLARETAEIVLLTEDLGDLLTARRLAQSAMGIVRQNIGLVAAPNSAGMLLAGLGQLPPLAAALLNNGSTVAAAVNALRPLRGS
jgi:Cu2+-exporting ATPase